MVAVVMTAIATPPTVAPVVVAAPPPRSAVPRPPVVPTAMRPPAIVVVPSAVPIPVGFLNHACIHMQGRADGGCGLYRHRGRSDDQCRDGGKREQCLVHAVALLDCSRLSIAPLVPILLRPLRPRPE